MKKQEIQDKLAAINTELQAGTYRPGAWQLLNQQLATADRQTLRNVADDLTKTSNLLHARHGYYRVPFEPLFIIELVLTASGIAMLATEQLWLNCIGLAAVLISLQPAIKVMTGLMLGLRYSHAYLWYFEPRFKMQFGRYLLLTPGQRITLHLMGSLGTPLAFAIGAATLSADSPLVILCILGFLGTAAMQVAAFLARYAGIRKIGKFNLAQLTTPAMLAEIMRERAGDKDRDVATPS